MLQHVWWAQFGHNACLNWGVIHLPFHQVQTKEEGTGILQAFNIHAPALCENNIKTQSSSVFYHIFCHKIYTSIYQQKLACGLWRPVSAFRILQVMTVPSQLAITQELHCLCDWASRLTNLAIADILTSPNKVICKCWASRCHGQISPGSSILVFFHSRAEIKT